MKKIGLMMSSLLLASAALMTFSCSGSSNEPDKPGPKPNSTTSAGILPFITRLSDGVLMTSEADFNAVDSYIGGLKDVGFIFLDRADGAGVSYVHKMTYKRNIWSFFAVGKQAGETFQGGYGIYYKNPSRTLKSHQSGIGAYMTGVPAPLTGVITRADGTKKVVDVDMKFYTARFETESQVNAFGSSTFTAVRNENKNFIAIGTVKNDLFASLQNAVKTADSAYSVTEVAKGSAYTIYMIAGARYWGLNGVEKKSVASGIDSYEINLMWK